LSKPTLTEILRQQLDEVLNETPKDRLALYSKMNRLLHGIHGICQCFDEISDPTSISKTFPYTDKLQEVVGAVSEAAKAIITAWETTYRSAEKNHPELTEGIEARVFHIPSPKGNDVRMS